MGNLGRDKVDLTIPLDVGTSKPVITMRPVGGREWEVLKDGVRVKLCHSPREADDLYWKLTKNED